MEKITTQATALIRLRKLFDEMCSSRRRLKPILTEIVKALDDNLFIDADSDEVKDLLDHIVQIQSGFSELDNLKSAAATKNVVKLESALTDLDNKNAVNEMKTILLRFKNLSCNSDDENVVKDAKKLQQQAHRLQLRVDKMNFDEFMSESKKFSDLADILDNPAKVSSTIFVETLKSFSDVGYLSFALAQKMFVLSKEEEEEPQPVEEADDDSELEAQYKAITKMLEQFLSNVTQDQLFANDAEFVIEEAEVKKKLSSKAFNNKLNSYIEGSKFDFLHLLNNFCDIRVFLIDKSSEPDEFNGYNYSPMIPTISDKLFQWGAVSKVHWRGLSFYYLNDYGYELLFKRLHSKDFKSVQKKPARRTMIQSLRQFIFLSVVSMFNLDKKNYMLDKNPMRFWIRTTMHGDDKPNWYMAVSLMMFEKDWHKNICTFFGNVELEIKSGRELRAIFIITMLDVKELSTMFRYLKKIGAKNVFAITFESKTLKCHDFDGDPIKYDDIINYLHDSSFDTFASYKSKNLKKKRSRKKMTEESVNVEPEKAKAIEKAKRGKKSKKSEKEAPQTDKTAEEDSASTFSLFPSTTEKIEKPAKNKLVYDFDPNNIVADNVVDETVADDVVADSVVADSVDDQKIIDDEEPTVASVEPTVEEVQAVDAIFTVEPAVLDNKIAINDAFLKEIMRNAIILFLRGSGARGLLELQILCSGEELNQLSESEMPNEIFDWFDGLTKLTAIALGEPSMHSQKDFMPLLYCDAFFERRAPFDELDTHYIKNFFAATFLLKESYAPDMNGIYELSNRQMQFLSDKSNAALKNCPSLKKLISLFKDFTEKHKAPFAASLHTDYVGIKKQFNEAMKLIENARGRADSVLHNSMKHPRVHILSKQLYDVDGIMRRKIELQDDAPDALIEFCRRFMDEGASFDGDYKKINDKLFSSQKVREYLDDIWNGIKVDSHRSEKFMGDEQTKQRNAFIQMLTALTSYAVAKMQLDAVGDGSPAPVAQALKLIDDIIDESRSMMRGIELNHIGAALMIVCLKRLKLLIEEKSAPPFYRECLLGTRYIELTAEGLPETDNIGALRYSFACRIFEYEQALGNQTLDEAAQAACETAIRSYDLGVFVQLEENYREQLNLTDEKIKQIRAAAGNQIKRRLDILHREFMQKLELERHYARVINPGDVDYYITAVESAKHHFDETKNAGLFERFIKALNVSIDRGAEVEALNLRARLETVKTPSARKHIEHLIDGGRLNIAEDCINEGGVGTKIDFDSELDEFLSEYGAIFNLCVKNRNEPLEKILAGLKRDMNDVQLREFAETWQNAPSKTAALPSLLQHLSFEGATLEPIRKQSNNQLEFHATFEEAPTELPFDIFNSHCATEGVDFVYMPYTLTFEQLIDALRNVERRRCPLICLLNMALSLGDRRKLAQSIKLRAELKNVVVLDRVLAVYLTAFEQSRRRKKLLNAALPFANVNPYDGDSTEIFVGREKELNALRDINGATFLVGGRQIGKTALLEQLIKLEHKPAEGSFVLKAVGDDWDAIRAEMVERLKSGNVKKLILLLDINKTFASGNSQEIAMFERLREEYAGRFKFIATARHISAANDNAVKLKPFTPEEAARFTVEPLRILGLNFVDESAVRSIWVQANYYPGLLKYYCGRIVEAIADNYELKNFDATKNPKYDFDDEFLKNMLNRHGLPEELNRRLIGTLHDAQDDYYYVIMLAAVYAAFDDATQPVNLARIQEMCLLNDVTDFYEMNEDVMDMMLEEMEELKLLRRTGETYEFYRAAFRYLFGHGAKEVETRLKECAERHATGNE